MLSISSTLFLDNFFRHYSANFASESQAMRKMLSFAVEYCRNLLAKNVGEKCRQMPLNHIKKNCCRIKSKNSVKKSCRKTLYNTIFFDIFRQISPKTSRRCEKCGRILAKNAVEYCQKKLLSNFIIRHYF